ncbi:unnamed protein product, partial [Symbiodinium sp. KB8]
KLQLCMVVFVYYRARSPFCQMTSWNQVEHMRPAFKLKPKFKGRSRILLDNLRRHTHALNAAEHLAPSDCFDLMRRSGTAKRRRRPPQALLIATCMDFMAFQHAGTVAPVFANGTVSSSISDGKDVRDLDLPLINWPKVQHIYNIDACSAFNGLLPRLLSNAIWAKRQRTDADPKGQGKSHKGKGRGKGKGKGGPQLGPKMEMWAYSSGSRNGLEPPWGREEAMSEYKDSETQPEWIEAKVHKLTQLVLRREQTLASLRQDMVMHLFMKNGESGMVPVLCETATKWRTTKEEAPSKLSYSLKIALFKQLLITLHERLEAASQKEEALNHAKSLGWVDSEGHWLTLRWNPGQQALDVDQTIRGVPAKDLLSQLVQMRRGSTEETILRFRSLRHLSTGVQAEWIQFQLVVSLRPEAAPVWSTLQGWIGSAAWHVLGCRLRRDRPAYDSLVNELWSYQ